MSGFLSRFAENNVWRKSIAAAIVFVPYRFERSHFAEIGHSGQSSAEELFLFTMVQDEDKPNYLSCDSLQILR